MWIWEELLKGEHKWEDRLCNIDFDDIRTDFFSLIYHLNWRVLPNLIDCSSCAISTNFQGWFNQLVSVVRLRILKATNSNNFNQRFFNFNSFSIFGFCLLCNIGVNLLEVRDEHKWPPNLCLFCFVKQLHDKIWFNYWFRCLRDLIKWES